LIGKKIIQTFTTMITDQQFKQAAKSLNCDAAVIKAVNQVESSGNGFLPDGRSKILFEGHIFWKQLIAAGIDPKPLQKANKDILYPVWNLETVRPLYKMDQYQRLEKAKKINETAALMSASWGAFQIMGFNFKACGEASVQDFVAAQQDEFNQLQCFCNYIQSTHLDVNLQHLDWKGFARAYNGPEYAKNLYDTKLAKAYAKFKG
jgi:hypothetical protein